MDFSSPAVRAKLAALLLNSGNGGGSSAPTPPGMPSVGGFVPPTSTPYDYSRPKTPPGLASQLRSANQLQDMVPPAPQQGPQPDFMPAYMRGQAQSPYPESGTATFPVFAQTPYPESGTQQPGGTPPFSPPDVARNTQYPAGVPQSQPMPQVAPQPTGLDPSAMPSVSSIDRTLQPSQEQLLAEWRKMMDMQQWARQGG